MARYVITGGGGFIGSNLVESLLGSGEDVLAFDDFSTGRRQNLERTGEWARAGGGTFKLIEGDIRNEATCREALAGADYVLHQAAIGSVPRSVEEPVMTNSVNVGGTLLLLEAAREAGVKRFVFASSSSLYGESDTLPKVESMPAAPISPYGLQKLTAETYVLLYHRLFGLPTVALRYFNVFGPRQRPDSDYAAVIPLFIAAARGGKPATVHGDGEQTRDFTFIENVVQANRLACSSAPAACGKAYNIACGSRYSLNDLLRAIGGIVGCTVEAKYVDPRSGDIRHSQAGIDLAISHLGYSPKADLEDGLRRTIEAA